MDNDASKNVSMHLLNETCIPIRSAVQEYYV